MRLAHHLIRANVTDEDPIACAERYEDAATFVENEIGKGRSGSLISLHIEIREREDGRRYIDPCPVCSECGGIWLDYRTPRNGVSH